MQINGIELEEYFRYHPPQTEERRLKHDAVNAAMLKYCQVLLSNPDREAVSAVKLELEKLLDAHFSNAKEDQSEITYLCCEKAQNELYKAYSAYQSNTAESKFSILLSIQAARMFLNLGITIYELRANQKPKPTRKRDPWKLIHAELEARGMASEELGLVDGCAIGLPEAETLARVSGTSVKFWLNLWEAWEGLDRG